MNAKQKAIELVDKFTFAHIYFTNKADGAKVNAKTCALRCVNEMIEQNGELFLHGITLEYYKEKNAFLFDVKTEIEKL